MAEGLVGGGGLVAARLAKVLGLVTWVGVGFPAYWGLEAAGLGLESSTCGPGDPRPLWGLAAVWLGAVLCARVAL